jgi:anti-anti-sigma factor
MHIERQLTSTPETRDLIVIKIRGNVAPPGDTESIDLGSLYGPEIRGRTVVLDLREADYLASSGVNWILTQRKEFEEAGGRLAVCAGEGMVLDVLRLMRLDRLMPIAGSPDAIARIVTA